MPGRHGHERTVLDIHTRVVAALHIVCGLLTLAVPLALAGFFTAIVGFVPSMNDPGIVGLITTIGSFILIPFILLGLGETVAGICLLGGGRTARGFVIAFGILQLINIPIGTAIGIYTLWALFRPDNASAPASAPPPAPLP